MSFARAARDEYHLTGSDDPLAPDYIKPPMRARRKPNSEERGALRPYKEPLPRVPLKASRPCWKQSALTRNKQDFELEIVDRSDAKFEHPLDKFFKPTALRYSGKHVDDGELAKITSIPYKADESLAERRYAASGRKASRAANMGTRLSIISAMAVA
mmetsp:Transcript_23039/g.50910  ORF Transcript_23039/g.50910 Transcript_23039/m.50910 type:complete len:157 (-) Transcript_23039:337-807(-)